MTEPKVCQRSLKLDVFTPDEQRQRIINSVRKYRATARHCYGILAMAHAAGAKIDASEDGELLRVIPQNDQAKIALSAAIGSAKIEKGEKVKGEGQQYLLNIGATLAYELRAHVLNDLCPSWMSFVWDSLRRDIATAWTSKDPEFPKASRSWLMLQGSRSIAQFNRRGIGFPVASAKPVLGDHSITLKWDREIGEVELKFNRLDSGRWAVYRPLMNGDEGWKPGTLFLTEKDGKLGVAVTYAKTVITQALPQDRILEVAVRNEKEEQVRPLVSMTTPDGNMEVIDREAVMDFLVRHEIQIKRREDVRAACGAKKAPWGHRRVWQAAQGIVNNMATLRERRQQDYNHAWTRRIVSRAVAWRCGTIKIEKEPERELSGLPWNWSQFMAFLRYKAEEAGIIISS